MTVALSVSSAVVLVAVLGRGCQTRHVQMTIFASFNYGIWPSIGILAIGACLGVVVLVGLAHCKSALAGLFGGAICWALIAFVVFSFGGARWGDGGLNAPIGGVLFGVIGAAAGLVAGLLGKRNRPPKQEQQDQGDLRS